MALDCGVPLPPRWVLRVPLHLLAKSGHAPNRLAGRVSRRARLVVPVGERAWLCWWASAPGCARWVRLGWRALSCEMRRCSNAAAGFCIPWVGGRVLVAVGGWEGVGCRGWVGECWLPRACVCRLSTIIRWVSLFQLVPVVGQTRCGHPTCAARRAPSAAAVRMRPRPVHSH